MPEQAIKTLMSHSFVPCEGGEHAIADQYMFAYLVKGKTEYDNGNYKKAMELFREGQHLITKYYRLLMNRQDYVKHNTYI